MQEPKFRITVMPDYGLGPYAWQKPVSDSGTLVGQCIATAFDGFETEEGITITTSLQGEFADWTAQFEQFAETPGFDWSAFHDVGLTLSKKLRRELGPPYQVFYRKPYEDPERVGAEDTRIPSDA